MSEHGKIQNAIESAKLGAMILQGRLTIIQFSDKATASPTFDLDQNKERLRMMQWLDKLTADSGTSYISAIDAVPAGTNAVVLISDGAPNETPDAIFERLHARINCPVHTIAVGATQETEALLVKISATTSGSHYRVQKSAEVVEAFLKVLGQIRPFRRLDIQEKSLKLDMSGEILAIGYNATPQFSIPQSQSIERHEAKLPSEKIHVARTVLQVKQAFVISTPEVKNSSAIRMTVLRFDMVIAKTKLERIATTGDQTTVRATTTFYDANGAALDPRTSAELSASYEVEDPKGQVQRIETQPSSDKSQLVGEFTLPNGQEPFVIRNRTIDRSSGVPYTATESVAFEPAALPALAPDTPKPLDNLSEDQLQLLVVSHRRSGRIVLFDSLQDMPERQALAGDELSVELVRGAMDPRMFVALGRRLQARVISADGAVTNVDLILKGDRYITQPVPIPEPGTVRIEVDIAVRDFQMHMEGKITVALVELEMVLAESSLFGKIGRVPFGAIIPFEVEVRGNTGNRSSTSSDLAEVMKREQIGIRWRLINTVNEVIEQQRHDPSEGLWTSRIWLRQRMGRHILNLELINGHGKVLQSYHWTFDIVESPVQFSVMAHNNLGGLEMPPASDALAQWLPVWLIKSPSLVITASPTKSTVLGTYFVEGATVDSVEAPFDKKLNCFVADVHNSGFKLCTGRLQVYQFGNSPAADLPEIQITEEVPVQFPLLVCWECVIKTVILGLFAICILGAITYRLTRQLYLHRITANHGQISLLGNSFTTFPIVKPRQKGWRWPSREIYIYRYAQDPEQVIAAYPSEMPKDVETIACVRQQHGGSAEVRALADLPDLGKNQSRVLEVGNESMRLTETITLSLISDGNASVS
jgi:microcompartment protein CcmK/EutM